MSDTRTVPVEVLEEFEEAVRLDGCGPRVEVVQKKLRAILAERERDTLREENESLRARLARYQSEEFAGEVAEAAVTAFRGDVDDGVLTPAFRLALCKENADAATAGVHAKLNEYTEGEIERLAGPVRPAEDWSKLDDEYGPEPSPPSPDGKFAHLPESESRSNSAHQLEGGA